VNEMFGSAAFQDLVIIFTSCLLFMLKIINKRDNVDAGNGLDDCQQL
jgi:hypothetical protein